MYCKYRRDRLLRWSDEELPASTVPKAPVRAGDYRHLREVVFAFPPQHRDVEALIVERGLSVDHTTMWRWTNYSTSRPAL